MQTLDGERNCARAAEILGVNGSDRTWRDCSSMAATACAIGAKIRLAKSGFRTIPDRSGGQGRASLPPYGPRRSRELNDTC